MIIRSSKPSVTRLRALAGAATLLLVASSCALPESALNREQPLAQRSVILSAGGTRLATVFEQNREVVTSKQIPKVAKDAIVAIEDARFWKHGAIDTRAIVRALVANVSAGRAAQGGSTITQQLAKLMFTDPDAKRTFKTKIVEARLAMTLEKKYTKDQILTMYLNRAYFGARAYGVSAAVETYFNKPLKKVTLGDAALLAGMVKAPTSLDPFDNPAGAKQRRDFVLQRMADERFITPEQAKTAAAIPLKLHRHPGAFKALRFPYFVQYVEHQILTDPAFGKTEEERAEKLYRGGLTIKTSINEQWQRYAEEAVRQTLPGTSDPEGALVAIDPHTGQVKAMVGGRNFFAPNGQTNIASSAKWQPGSAFKPFTLGAAIEQGISPESHYNSSPTTINIPGYAPWHPDNDDHRSHGIVTLRTGMADSINAVYARLIKDVGVDNVVDFAHRAGLALPLCPNPGSKVKAAPTCFYAVPSITLGALTNGVSPLLMASAYGTFAANGLHMPPHGIAQVIDAHGTNVYDDRKLKGEHAIDPNVAYTLTSVLQTAACCGTARPAQFGRPMAAKTGTTENHNYVWLVGYTPDLVTAVAVGYRHYCPRGAKPGCPRRMPQILHGRTPWGATFAAPIWRFFMSHALANTPKHDFINPPGSLPLHFHNNLKGGCRGAANITTAANISRVCPSSTPKPQPSGGQPTGGPTTTVHPPRPRPRPKPKPKPKPSPQPQPTLTVKPHPSPSGSPSAAPT